MTPITFLDAAMFIGAPLAADPRHIEARPIVEAARTGQFAAATSAAVLCEVYAALTWLNAQPPHAPEEAANAVRILVQPPSAIRVLSSGSAVALAALELAARHQLTVRRTHDAHHAGSALSHGVTSIFTYDLDDWQVFESDGLTITGPPSVLARLGR